MRSFSRTLHCCVAVLIFVIVTVGQSRRPPVVGDETGRDAVGFRKDSVTKETVGDPRVSSHSLTTKQAVEDFLQIQKINRQIQEQAEQAPLALVGIAAQAKELRTRANRLKTNLSIPSPPKDAISPIARSESTAELLTRIEELDVNIKEFVRNPMFRQINDSGRDLQMEASISLGKVIALSKVVEEGAGRLRQ